MQRCAPRADRFVASRRLPGGGCQNDFLPVLFTPTEEPQGTLDVNAFANDQRVAENRAQTAQVV